MKMQSLLPSLLVLFTSATPLFSATEVERLRALCAEQELQIAQLEVKIAHLTDTPPPTAKRSSSSSQAASSESGNKTYKVAPGDNIVRIARDNGTTANALAEINGIKTTSIIHPGQILKLPKAGAETSVENVEPKYRSHTVASGDTFYKIAREHGMSVAALIAANPGVNHQALRLGQEIRIESLGNARGTEKPSPSLASSPSMEISNRPAPVQKKQTSGGPIKIEKEISYGRFAKDHGTTTTRLDQLNGLELDPATVLAQGSELYIPTNP